MAATDVNPQPLPPLVFSCLRCKSTITDTSQFIASVRSLNLLVFKGDLLLIPACMLHACVASCTCLVGGGRGVGASSYIDPAALAV